MLTLTSAVRTPWHGIPAGAKLLALCGVTAVLFTMETPLGLGLMLGGVVALHLPGGRDFLRGAGRALWPVWPFVAVVGLWHLWTESPQAGAVVILRMLTAIAAANLVTMTTRLDDMLAVIERLARPLALVGLRPRVLALAVALTIRFVPVLAARVGRIRDAHRARSARRPGRAILLPVALSVLDDADHVADALRARGGAG